MNITELIQLLELPNKNFGGYLVLKNQEVAWKLAFVQGRFLYAEDERHAVRRWTRGMKQYCPTYDCQVDATQSSDERGWQMHLLNQGLDNQQLSMIRIKLMLRTLLQECLFEMSLCDRLEREWQAVPFSISQTYRSIALSNWEIKMTFGKVKSMQEQWLTTGIAQCSPAQSPTLKKEVKASQLPTNLPFDHAYLRGDFTLWEIAGRLNRQPQDIATSLRPFVQGGTLEFLTVPDLSTPPTELIAAPASQIQTPPTEVAQQALAPKSKPSEPHAPHPHPSRSEGTPPLIACIDDSPVLGHSLKKILTSAGYDALIIQEPMRGFSQLIEHRPALILLDLMLPNADGYSICKFLRDTPVFKKTPIIILTGHSKPVDRVRARLAGATEFLIKPPNSDQLLGMIHSHLDTKTCVM
ncbi:MAG: response regulator [Elainellaceae cyanobacterium]